MSSRNQKRALTLAIPMPTSYFQWKWIEKSSKRVLMESKRKFLFRNACMENALILKPVTLQSLKMQILHFDDSDACTRIEDIDAANITPPSIGAAYSANLNSPATSYNSSSIVPADAVMEDTIIPVHVDKPAAFKASEDEDTDCSLDVEVGEETTYEWEWQPRDSNGIKLISGEYFTNTVLCIEDALRNKPKEFEADLQLNSNFGGIRINSELVPEDDKRLKTQRVVFDVDVTVKTASRTVAAGNAKLRATYYKGQPRIDIRRWKKLKDERVIPTKKGVSLPPQRWLRLINERERVDKLLERVMSGENICERIHIGGPLYGEVKYPFWTVQLREMYMDKKSGEIKHSKRGIILTSSEWRYIMNAAEEIKEKMPHVSNSIPCYLQDDHNNQVCSHSILYLFPYINSHNNQLRNISIHLFSYSSSTSSTFRKEQCFAVNATLG